MMDIERERKKLELRRVELAIEEKKFKILERRDDIARLEADIKVSENRVKELNQMIEEG